MNPFLTAAALGFGTLVVATPTTVSDPATFFAADFEIRASLTGADNASLALIGTDAIAAETILLDDDITTAGNDILLDDSVIVVTDATLASNGGNITVTGPVDAATGSERLDVAASTGAIAFNAATGATTPLAGADPPAGRPALSARGPGTAGPRPGRPPRRSPGPSGGRRRRTPA